VGQFWTNINMREKQGKYDQAIADLTSAIRLTPDDAQLYKYRSVDYEKIDQWRKAVADTTIAIRLAPTNANAYQYRADDLTWMGQDSQAFDDYAKALHIEPAHAGSVLGLAQLHFYRAEFRDALSGLDQYLASKHEVSWDAYAFVWRYLAATRLHVDGRSRLIEQTHSLKADEWPYPVIDFYLHRIDESTLLERASA
jgi:tetratricopeptide (TPR) repeat protein